MNQAIQSAVEAGALQSAQDFIGEAIGEAIAARHESDERFGKLIAQLELAERENDEMRRQIAESRVDWFTEEQLAAKIGCSVDVLQRLRLKRKIPCTRLAPRVFRYTTFDEIEIARLRRVAPEMFVVKPKKRRFA